MPMAARHSSLWITPVNRSFDLNRKVGTYSRNAGRRPRKYDTANAAPVKRITPDDDLKTQDAVRTTDMIHIPVK